MMGSRATLDQGHNEPGHLSPKRQHAWEGGSTGKGDSKFAHASGLSRQICCTLTSWGARWWLRMI